MGNNKKQGRGDKKMSGGISMMTRVERIISPGQDNVANIDLKRFDHAFERRLNWIGEKFPVKKSEDLSWSAGENEYFARMGRILNMIGSADDESVQEEEKVLNLSRKSVIPALKGVKSACRAVDDLIAGKANQIICAIRNDESGNDTDDLGDEIGYSIFGNAALAAHYALGKNSISRVAIVDFDVDHGEDIKNLVRNNTDILLISASVGASKKPPHASDKEASNCRELNLPKICHKNDIERIFAESIEAPLVEFKPDIIILSMRPDAPDKKPAHPIEGHYVNEKIFSYAQKFSKGRYICILEGKVDQKTVESFKLE